MAVYLIISDAGLIGNVHPNRNPFVSAAFIVSLGDVCYFASSIDRAIACAMRNMPRGASIVRA